MTYLQIRYVPDSRHVFYRYAFQTLYTLHDASKQGFQRRRFVEMGESDFINVFSLFCLISYADMEHSFTRPEIISYLDKVKSRSRVQYDSEMFLKECVESVNLIYKDGDLYSFLHRSFQEYFCAYAVTHYFPDKISEVIEKLPAQRSDSVFSMMYSINPDVISRMYIINTYKLLQKEINLITKQVDHVEILSSFKVKVDILFSGRRESAFGYRVEYLSKVHHFVDAVVCIFKNDIPTGMSREFVGYPELQALTTALRALVPKIGKSKNTLHYRAQFDFAEKRMLIFSGENRFSDNAATLDREFSSLEKGF